VELERTSAVFSLVVKVPLVTAGGGTGVAVGGPPGVTVGETVGVEVSVAVTNCTIVTGPAGLELLLGEQAQGRAMSRTSGGNKRMRNFFKNTSRNDTQN
jgi:hypothetical protein